MSARTRAGGSAARCSAVPRRLVDGDRGVDHQDPLGPRLLDDAVGPLGLRRVAGEGEEHVVERGPAQRDVGDDDAVGVEGPQGLGERRCRPT